MHLWLLQMAKATKVRRHTIEGRTIASYGYESDLWQDFYHLCLTASWAKFFATAALTFTLLNVFFACLFLIQPNSISNLSPPNFWGAFFFSVETIATVGYGDMHPQTLYGHVLATIDIFIGLVFVAALTGLIFARFSKPKSRILFTDHLVLSDFNGQPTLMLRAANARQNQIANATAKMHVLIQEVTLEGKKIRRIYDLDLVRSDQPMFFLTWTIMHTITPSSPLYGLTADQMAAKDLIFLIRIVGFDEGIAQEIHMRQSYSHDQIVWGHQFVDVSNTDPQDRTIHIDYKKFHLTHQQTKQPEATETHRP
jgi:inward rectifier potassium channel